LGWVLQHLAGVGAALSAYFDRDEEVDFRNLAR